MKDGDKLRLGVIRLINAAIKQREVDERLEIGDGQIIAVLDKMSKQCRESIEQYNKAGRDDLAKQEAFELGVLKTYLPEALSETEIDTLVQHAIGETAASTIKDMGKIIALLKPKLQGRADMSSVSAKIKTVLSS